MPATEQYIIIIILLALSNLLWFFLFFTRAGYLFLRRFGFDRFWRGRYLRYPFPRFPFEDGREWDKWLYTYMYSDEAAKAEEFIREREYNYGVRLSVPAREMLLIPVLERSQDQEFVDYKQLDRSLSEIFMTIQEDPSDYDRGKENQRRSSLSVIKAFWKRFCNIPPFCSKKEERG